MSLKRWGLLFTALSLVLTGPGAFAVTIDFESYPDPMVFDTFTDSGATFTTVGGGSFAIATFGVPSWGTGGPLILCPRLAVHVGFCDNDFEVTFATAVSDLSFLLTVDNEAGLFLSVDVYLNDVLLGTQLSGPTDGDIFTAHLVDLSGFGSLDRIVVHEPGDFAGLGYDDFTFEAAAVPEPGSLAFLGGGLLALAALTRRR